MDCSPLGSSVHGILQVRILEWVAISCSRADQYSEGIKGWKTWPRERLDPGREGLEWGQSEQRKRGWKDSSATRGWAEWGWRACHGIQWWSPGGLKESDTRKQVRKVEGEQCAERQDSREGQIDKQNERETPSEGVEIWTQMSAELFAYAWLSCDVFDLWLWTPKTTF